MNTTNRPLRARTSVPRALAGALQWRLLLLWIGATLLCALVGASSGAACRVVVGIV